MVEDENQGSVSSSARETIQPGTSIDKRLWKRFKNDVRDRRGRINGVLANELERAIESYLDASKGSDVTDELRRLREDVDQIRDVVIEETPPTLSDGGSEKEKNSAGKDSVRKPVDRDDETDDRSIVEKRTDAALAELVANTEQFTLDELDDAIETGAGVSSRQSLKKYRKRVFDRLGGKTAIEHPATKKKPLERKIFYTDVEKARVEQAFHLIDVRGATVEQAIEQTDAFKEDVRERIEASDLDLDDVEAGDVDFGESIVGVEDAESVGDSNDVASADD